MRVLSQSVRDGTLTLRDVPRPSITSTQVLVDTRASLISIGTERHLRELASSSLVGKARARPDLVRQVADRLRRDGLRHTWGAVNRRLDEEMPLGYSAAGVVIEVGEAVVDIRPGERVSTAGAGHADLQVVAGNLTNRIPETISLEQAAFAAVGSVAMHAHRLAEIGPGDRLLVIGLGLVGQIAVQIGTAAGALTAAVDLDQWKVDVAHDRGILSFVADDGGWNAINDWSDGRGADAVLVTAATSSSDPMLRGIRAARDRGTVVIVGDVGLDLDRRPLYEKELTLKIARSYGPGRYDPTYEQLGIDYPYGQVRWTAGRNMRAVIDLISTGSLDVDSLITHRFTFDRVKDAYSIVENEGRVLGVVIDYEPVTDREVWELTRTPTKIMHSSSDLASGLIGAGRFAESTLLPSAAAAGFGPWTGVVSSSGQSANRVAESYSFNRVGTAADSIIGADDTRAVFIASPHSTHAELTVAALNAGKHVFCEKPLAITEQELDEVIAAFGVSSRALMVGFNRRWSPAVAAAREFIGVGNSPTQILYRVNAGSLPPDHWLNDRRQGGRMIGEGCHFVDTSIALVGSFPTSVYAVTSGKGEAGMDEDFTILLGFADGSQSSIVYNSTAPRGVGKEHIQILGRDRSAIVVDFRDVVMSSGSDSKTKRYKPPDKGHKRQFEVFRELIEGKRPVDTIANDSFVTMRATLAALSSATTGRPVHLETT